MPEFALPLTADVAMPAHARDCAENRRGSGNTVGYPLPSRRRGIVVVVAFLFALLAASSALAAGHVDSDASGCDDSRVWADVQSSSTPWCSLNRALKATPDGQTVYLHNSSSAYTTGVDELLDAGTSTTNMIVAPAPGENPTVGYVFLGRPKHITFSGLSFNAGLSAEQPQHFTLQDNTFDGNGVDLRPTDDSADVLVDSNTFQNNGTHFNLFVNGEDHSFTTDTGVTISNNLFKDGHQDGIQLGGGLKGVQVIGNECDNITNDTVAGTHADCLQLVGTDGTTIKNNYFHDSDEPLTIVHTVNTYVDVENNRFVDNTGVGCDCGHMPHATFLHNTFWNNAGADSYSDTWRGIRVIDDWLDPPHSLTATTDMVVKYNVLDSLGVDSLSMYAAAATGQYNPDYNVYRGSVHTGFDPSTSTSHDQEGTPTFNTDWSLATGSVGLGEADHGLDIGWNDPSNAPPTVSLTAPTSPLSWNGTSGYTITATATASDDHGITEVRFYQTPPGGSRTLMATDTSAPYSTSWSIASTDPEGFYTIEAVAYDADGLTDSSSIVGDKQNPPTVSLTAPSNGLSWNGTSGYTIYGTATASDAADAITEVRFYQTPPGGSRTLMATDTSAPYSTSWSIASTDPEGNYTIEAVAYDADGLYSSSSVVVDKQNPPTVSLTAPTDGIDWNGTSGYTIYGTATASDSADGITKVEFWQQAPGGSYVLKATDTSSPYAASWSVSCSDPEGTYHFQAKAYDGDGLTSTSTVSGLKQGHC